jgi:D-alanyl-D-alanine carboxypeptidase
MTGTTANLKSGKWIRLYNLLYGAMLPSGNDAAYSLA